MPIGCYKPNKEPYEITNFYENGTLKSKPLIEDYSGFLHNMSLWTGELSIEPEEITEETFESQYVTHSEKEILDSLKELQKSLCI